jgi:hypothetical protein
VTDDDYGEDRDPLLVRPFLLHDSGSASDESTQTWPSATTREVRSQRAFEGADDPTAIFELPAGGIAALRRARHAHPRRRRHLLLAVAGAVVLLGVAAVGFVAVRSDVRPLASAALPGEPLPAVTGPPGTSAAAPAASTPSPARSATTEAGRASATTAPAGRVPSAAAVPSLPRTSAPAPIGTTAPQPVPPPGNRLMPPPTDRTGVIRGQNGLCLDLDGGIPVDGNQVQVFTCNSTAAQVWTLAADGTLRVSGKCALLVGDNTVHIVGCDGRTTAQWRASGQLLMSAAGGGCLTDPSGGRASGTAVTVTPCGGSAGQRWSLP